MAFIDSLNPDAVAHLHIKFFLEFTAKDLCCDVEDIVKDLRIEGAYDVRADDYIFHISLKLCSVNCNRSYSIQDTLVISSETIRNDLIRAEPNSMTMLLDKISQLIEPRVKELKEQNADKIKAKEKADWDATTKKRLKTYTKSSIYKDESLHR